ncbi:MAG: AAA family ATPase [Actinomycetota bacterium]|nr:AAA family ATPase [Actinomycetota bacterium]
MLVGREEERACLGGAVEAALTGQGSMILLVGEAGMGKSRLACEAVEQARRRDLRVLKGRAVPAAAPIAFRPMREALLSYLRHRPPPPAPELQPFRPALGRLVPEWRGEGAKEGQEDSVILLAEALVRLLRVLAGSRGCLLVLEDLHWADPETLAVVEYLSDNVDAEPVMCLGTLRSDESSDALPLAGRLEARRAATVLELAPLCDAEVAVMARACLGVSEIADQVWQLLRLRAEGRPFFIEELLAAAVASGALQRTGQRCTVTEKIHAAVPRSFADTVRRRLTTLGPEARRVLHAAALLGRRFAWTLLGPVTGLDEGVVHHALRSAVDAQLVAPDGEGFRFRHALTRDAVLDEVLPLERQHLARRALDTVEAAHPGLPPEWCELAAELAEQAGDSRRAGELLLEVARRAAARGALASAEAALERVRVCARGDASRLVEADQALVEVLSLAGKVDRAVEVGEGLLRAWRTTDAARAARVSLRLARAAVAAARWEVAAGFLAEADRLDATDPHVRPQIAALSAHVELGRDRPEQAAAEARAAIFTAEAAGMPEVACEALEVVGRCARLGDLDAAEEAFEQAYALAEAHDLTVWRMRALHELGTIDLLRSGGASGGRLVAARELALQTGALVTAATVDLQLAAASLVQFDADSTWTAAATCADIARRLHLDLLLAMALAFQGGALAIQGRHVEAEQVLDQAQATMGSHPDVRAVACFGRAMASLLDDDQARARKELEAAVTAAGSSPGAARGPFFGLWALMRAVADLGGAEACEQVRAGGAAVHHLSAALLHYADAVNLGRCGRRQDAETAALAADASLAQLEWYRHLARRLVAEAALTDGWGEPVRWLKEALAFFAATGCRRLASACRSLLRKSGVLVPREGRGEADVPLELRMRGVTSREMDVLLLVTDGLANREIASRLYLSPRTIERHVASLSAKLGAVTRSQLVALAVRTTHRA